MAKKDFVMVGKRPVIDLTMVGYMEYILHLIAQHVDQSLPAKMLLVQSNFKVVVWTV